MEQQTSITEAGAKKGKKNMPTWGVAVVGLIVLVAFGLVMFMAAFSRPPEVVHEPTADDIAQFKLDSDRADREQRQRHSAFCHFTIDIVVIRHLVCGITGFVWEQGS